MFRTAIKSTVIADTVLTAPQTSLTTAFTVTEQTQTTLDTVVMTAAQP